MTKNFTSGQCDIKKIDLINKDDKKVSLLSIFRGISIHQDLFSSGVYGSIIVEDSNNIQQEFSLQGKERLIIEFRTNEEFSYVRQEFYVYSIEDFSERNTDTATFTLQFVSMETIENQKMRVSKSFMNMSPSKIVKEVLKNELKSTKQVFISDSSGSIDYIAPNIKPLEIIASMASRASLNGMYDYLFYEHQNGYVFDSVSNLKSKDSFATYKITQKGYDEKDNFYSINGFSLETKNDELKNYINGFNGCKVISIDLDKRQYNEYKSHESVDSGFMKYVVSDDDRAKGMAIRYHELAKIMNGKKLMIEVAGNSDLSVGMMVKIDFPSKNSNDHKKQKKDSEISGKYLVVSLRHSIVGHSFFTSLELTDLQ